MAKTSGKSRAAERPSAPGRARRIEARRATAERKLRILERLTMGASVANSARVEKVTIRRVRQIIAEMLARREVDPPAGFVQLQIARLGDAMVVAHTMMREGDLQATEYRRRALVCPFAARSETGQKTAPKSLTFHAAGHGSACRDLSPHDGGRLMRSQSPPTVSLAARKKFAPLALDIVRSPENDASPPPRPYRTSTFLNCQGSDASMSSGKRPGRPVSGVQSV